MKRADPLTRLIAERVAQLRKAAGIDQAVLGARMSELRPGWSRSTVVKLENLNRESLSVGDLVALAIVLNVPPPMLFADPRYVETVPIGEGRERTAWEALLWFIGSAEDDSGYSSGKYEEAAAVIRSGRKVVEAVAEVRETLPGSTEPSDDDDVPQHERDTLRDALDVIAQELTRLDGAKAPYPPLEDEDIELIYDLVGKLRLRRFPRLEWKPDA